MKKFIAVIVGLLITPVFAEVMPAYYDEVAEYADEFIDEPVIEEEETAEVVKPVVPVMPAGINQRGNTGRAVSRTISSTSSGTSRGTAASRAVASRNTVSVATRNAASTTGSSRSVAATGQNVSSRRGTPASNSNAVRAASSSIVQTDTVNSPLYTGRVGVRPVASAAVRAPSVTRITPTGTSTEVAAVATGPTMDEIAQMTDFCKAQYTQCMDNFCNILDDNQGRCSCSVNIKNYSKTEEGLKKATEELQDVAQKIQYIGLTKDEIETIFSQTEAEAAMQGRVDNTQLKNDLDKVKSLVLNVKSGSAVSGDMGLSLDLSGLLDFSFDSTGFDLSQLFGGSSTSSINNQRGGELYKTATARCKASVLDSCKSQGVDTAIITNNYDLEIDKQCIVYERSLTDANTQMLQTVRNAKSVLQKARLIVAQQKNSYDLRGCVNALDSCMQDEFVCGSDYENCLDPSGKFIVNGTIVAGSEPGPSGGDILPSTTSASGIYSVWNYTSNNAWGSGTLGDFITQFIGSTTPVATNMVGFFQQKIGYNADGKNYGMCMSVLNKCQDITYTNGVFQRNNKVIDSYLQRTLIQVKAGQDEVLARYSESCISEVGSCLSSNGYSSTASPATQNAAVNACSALIRTCKSVTRLTDADIIAAATHQ